ncbi:MAG: phosphoribosylanthranilate isomerase [Ignavibacteriota bacterium]
MKVKICGITNLEDALLCEKLGADALGFIFYDKGKRHIEPNSAADIIKLLSPFTLKVGVFVNEIPENINAISKLAGLNIVQLHGDESPQQIIEINLPAIKAFRVSDDFDFDILNDYKNCYFLFDTYSVSEYGGTGTIFNWNIIPQVLKCKIILSGGVSSSNINRIVKEINPCAVDISSSLEEYPGKKSEIKLKEFFNILKGTN